MLLVCPSPITSNCLLGKEVTVHSRGLWSPLRAEQIHHLEFSTGNLPIIPLLFVGSIIYLRIDLWIFVLYFRLSSNNSLFCCSHCSRFGLWKLFQLVPVSICHISIFLFFYLFTLPSVLQNATGSSCVFPAPVLKSIISPRRMSGASLNLSERAVWLESDLTGGQ